MSDAILILNAGSSSIKFSVFPGHQTPSRQGIICEGECEGIGHRVHFTAKDRAGASLISEYLTEGTTHEGALAALLRWLEDRREALTANANCREHHYLITAYADADGRLLALDCEATVDSGAYSAYPFSACLEGAQVVSILPGLYERFA